MGLSHSPSIVTDGLVLCLDAANPRSYPGSGSTIYDISGNGYTGTITGTLPHNGKYFTFNATQHITTTATPLTLGVNDNSYTCEAVLSFADMTGDHMVFGNTAQGIRMGWHLGSRNALFYFGHYGNDTNASGASAETPYHMTWVFTKGSTSNNAKIWVNSVNRSGGGANLGTYIATNNVLIGAGFNTTNTRFAGNLHYVRIYNRDLSSDEIRRNYLATKSRFGL